jgi:ribonuclease-3
MEIEKLIGITFKNKQLLKNAFIHRSYLNEHKSFDISSNEKLEFLGDSVLALITAIYLYRKYPDLHEGEYTDIKSAVVKTESLYQAAINLQLGNYLYLSKGEEKNKGRQNKSILADCFEALIAAIFLDCGFEKTFQFVTKFLFRQKIDRIVKNRFYGSAKNRLQEYLQNVYKKLPNYLIINESGPDHDKKYTIAVIFNNKKMGHGFGKSKKEAEEKAAVSALQKFRV